MNRQYHYRIGQRVSYILLPIQEPTHPEHEYHGIVTGICPESEQVRVKLTDPEYDGLEEWVEVDQITEVSEPQPGEQNGEQNRLT